MMEVMESIFGTYTLVDGCTNWQYIGGIVIFSIAFYGVIRIFGSVISAVIGR